MKRRAEILHATGVRGHDPPEKFENQVSQIDGKWISDYLFSFSHKSLLQLGIFLKHITRLVLNFHCQRYFDDCLKISVLGRFDRN